MESLFEEGRFYTNEAYEIRGKAYLLLYELYKENLEKGYSGREIAAILFETLHEAGQQATIDHLRKKKENL